jgi:hypothetical protein
MHTISVAVEQRPDLATKRTVQSGLFDSNVQSTGDGAFASVFICARDSSSTVIAYFSDRGRLFQSERGRRFSLMADGRGGARKRGVHCSSIVRDQPETLCREAVGGGAWCRLIHGGGRRLRRTGRRGGQVVVNAALLTASSRSSIRLRPAYPADQFSPAAL